MSSYYITTKYDGKEYKIRCIETDNSLIFQDVAEGGQIGFMRNGKEGGHLAVYIKGDYVKNISGEEAEKITGKGYALSKEQIKILNKWLERGKKRMRA